MGNEDSKSFESVLHANEAFVDKLLSRRSSSGQYLQRDYYCKEPGTVPFIWEVQPGIPKDAPNGGFLPPPISPPPATRSPPRRPKPSSTQPRSCFLNKPKKTRKVKKVQIQMELQGHHEEFGRSESSNSDNGFFSSPCASKSSSSTSARGSPSSKALALPSLKFRSLAEGLLRRFF